MQGRAKTLKSVRIFTDTIYADKADWQLDNEFHVRPDKTPFDGFYAAALVRR